MYDITNVLQSAGLIEMTSKRHFRWVGAIKDSALSVEISTKKMVRDEIEKRCKIMDAVIEQEYRTLKEMLAEGVTIGSDDIELLNKLTQERIEMVVTQEK